MQKKRKKTNGSYRIDETYIKFKDELHYLCRAIDFNGDTVDSMLSIHRNSRAVRKFFRKIKSCKNNPSPRRMVANKYSTYPKIIKTTKHMNHAPYHPHPDNESST